MHPLGLLITYNGNLTAIQIYLQSTESTIQDKMMSVQVRHPTDLNLVLTFLEM